MLVLSTGAAGQRINKDMGESSKLSTAVHTMTLSQLSWLLLLDAGYWLTPMHASFRAFSLRKHGVSLERIDRIRVGFSYLSLCFDFLYFCFSFSESHLFRNFSPNFLSTDT